MTREWLVSAGQIEQAVADSGGPRSIGAVTDAAAELFISGAGREKLVASLWRAADQVGDGNAEVRIPEGFAWYALYPDCYARTAERWALANAGRRTAVLGIRSIGTSLSAVVAAELRRRGVPIAGRWTLRPQGHPFQRFVELPEDLTTAEAFIIVDEGPGLSGSSMAGVAAALHAGGVAEDSIVFFPGHGNGPGGEAGAEQRRWWRKERCWFSPAEVSAPEHAVFGGFAAGDETLETLAEIKNRRQMRLAEKGFVLPSRGVENGWIALEEAGRPLTLQDGNADFILGRLAPYVATAATTGEDDTARSLALARITDALLQYAREQGLDSGAIHKMRDRAARETPPLLFHGDGRLHPGDWRRLEDGRILKRNATGTDCDHSWTGRQSVLWDVAGAAVEWSMSDETLTLFLETLSKGYGIEAGPWALAFHRAGYCCLNLARARHEGDEQNQRRYEGMLRATLSEMTGQM